MITDVSDVMYRVRPRDVRNNVTNYVTNHVTNPVIFNTIRANGAVWSGPHIPFALCGWMCFRAMCTCDVSHKGQELMIGYQSNRSCKFVTLCDWKIISWTKVEHVFRGVWAVNRFERRSDFTLAESNQPATMFLVCNIQSLGANSAGIRECFRFVVEFWPLLHTDFVLSNLLRTSQTIRTS